MAQLTTTDIYGDLKVRDNIKSDKEIYEQGQALEDKYGSKSLLEEIESLARSSDETVGNLGNISSINRNDKKDNYLNGSGLWSTPPNNKYSAGRGLSLASGTVFSANIATSAVLGSVIVGEGVSVDTTGKISVSTKYAPDTHVNEKGNGKHLPAQGVAGQFLAHNATWVTPIDTLYKGSGNISLNATTKVFDLSTTFLSDYAGVKSNASGAAEVTGDLRPLAFLDLNKSAVHYANGTGGWSIPPDTKYTPGTGITLVNGQFKHTNSIDAGSVKEGGVSRTLGFSTDFKIPSFNYDKEGHVTSISSVTLTMPKNPDTLYKADSLLGIHLDTKTNTFSLTSVFRDSFSAVEGLTRSLSETVGNLGEVRKATNIATHYLSATGYWTKPIDTTYTAGLGLALTGTKFSVKDEYVKKAGDVMHGDLQMGAKRIINVANIGVGTSAPNFGVDTAEDIRIRKDKSLKLGGNGASDVTSEIRYNEETESIDFNFFQ